MLKEARKLSGVSWVDLCYRMQKTQSTVIGMLSGRNDPGMNKLISYIRAIDAEILLSQKGKTVAVIESDNDLTN